MAIELATQFQAYTDEQFYSESKTSLVTNKDFSFDGAKTIKLYKVKTTDMEDFNRNGPILDGNKSQYGTISTLQATTETFTINKDRSFTFEVDKMDTDETKMQVAAASALARQQREKVFPEIDSYVYSVMAANAGIKPEAAALTAENIYTQIITANAQMPIDFKSSLACDPVRLSVCGGVTSTKAAVMYGAASIFTKRKRTEKMKTPFVLLL